MAGVPAVSSPDSKHAAGSGPGGGATAYCGRCACACAAGGGGPHSGCGACCGGASYGGSGGACARSHTLPYPFCSVPAAVYCNVAAQRWAALAPAVQVHAFAHLLRRRSLWCPGKGHPHTPAVPRPCVRAARTLALLGRTCCGALSAVNVGAKGSTHPLPTSAALTLALN